MAESKRKLDFEAGQDNWETFVERLELYFLANEITDELKRRAILLTKVSTSTYILIRDLCAPSKPKDKTFEELKVLIKQHLSPEPSETMERYKFHKASKQHQNQ
ncbi:enzymatic poly [Lasius niger]|uniref:Enzymatic poly n=1 Tax=Lasius niger TaxID=67767 RepID=A0A0J7JZ33_LASNI|nr:enzymatic poly [Lasius niger]